MEKSDVVVLVTTLYMPYPNLLSSLLDKPEEAEQAVSAIIEAIKQHKVRGEKPFATVTNLEDAFKIRLARGATIRRATRLMDDLAEIVAEILSEE